jgi:hypothetical protein
MITTSQFIDILDIIIWPAIIFIMYLVNRKSLDKVFNNLVKRVEKGAALKFGIVEFGAMPGSIDSPGKDEQVNENHIALVHSSWRYAKKDEEFGKKMYVIQVVVFANDDVMEKIEKVRYILHPTYKINVHECTNRAERFEMKELAWGDFILRAEIQIKGQTEKLKLTRYINLAETGSNLLQ